LKFHSPTPIQRAAIPVTTTGKRDLVGAAETGSGKTLAFALPVVDFLLRNWEAYANRLSPVAMIIAPTRELAMQITSVMKEVCGPFRAMRKIEVVSVVGGMSEQKQRRQLCGGAHPANSSGGYRKPVHVLVATPGRLCELIQDDTIPMFADMSGIRFLIVDEADRIVEEGHFPEVGSDCTDRCGLLSLALFFDGCF
jgi:ATP-dependent RNA helicase DDX24/MAK5